MPRINTHTSSRLDNAAFLTRQYFEEELVEYGYAQRVPLAVLRQHPPFPPSALICKLYMRFGPRFLHRLRGHWSFICYDSVTMRILAAREPYGERMWLGKLVDGGIFASFGGTLPPGTAEVQELLPGCYKYGWHCEPLQFAPSPVPQPPHAEEPPSPSKKKTRRGARGGRRRSRSGTSPPCSPRVRAILCIIMHVHHNAQASFDSGSDGECGGAADAAFDDEQPSFAPSMSSSHSTSMPLDIPRTIAEECSSDDECAKELPPTLRAHLDPANCDPASLRLLQSMLYRSPCALAVTDAGVPDHPIVFVNAAFTMQTGYPASECVGRNCRFLQAPPDAERVPCFSSTSLRKALDAGTRCSVRILNYRADGVPLMNALSIVPLRNKSGTITHFIGMQAFTCVDDVVPPRLGIPVAEGGLTQQLRRAGSIRSKSKSCNDLAGIATRVCTPCARVEERVG